MVETSVNIITELVDHVNQEVHVLNWLLDSITNIVTAFVTNSAIAHVAELCTSPTMPAFVGVFFTSFIAVTVFDFIRGR